MRALANWFCKSKLVTAAQMALMIWCFIQFPAFEGIGMAFVIWLVGLGLRTAAAVAGTKTAG